MQGYGGPAGQRDLECGHFRNDGRKHGLAIPLADHAFVGAMNQQATVVAGDEVTEHPQSEIEPPRLLNCRVRGAESLRSEILRRHGYQHVVRGE